MKYDVEGFEKIGSIRFKKETVKLIRKIVAKDPETYESVSHFVRSSTIKRMREEQKRLKL
jgi:hypothetical protein